MAVSPTAGSLSLLLASASCHASTSSSIRRCTAIRAESIRPDFSMSGGRGLSELAVVRECPAAGNGDHVFGKTGYSTMSSRPPEKAEALPLATFIGSRVLVPHIRPNSIYCGPRPGVPPLRSRWSSWILTGRRVGGTKIGSVCSKARCHPGGS